MVEFVQSALFDHFIEGHWALLRPALKTAHDITVALGDDQGQSVDHLLTRLVEASPELASAFDLPRAEVGTAFYRSVVDAACELREWSAPNIDAVEARDYLYRYLIDGESITSIAHTLKEQRRATSIPLSKFETEVKDRMGIWRSEPRSRSGVANKRLARYFTLQLQRLDDERGTPLVEKLPDFLLDLGEMVIRPKTKLAVQQLRSWGGGKLTEIPPADDRHSRLAPWLRPKLVEVDASTPFGRLAVVLAQHYASNGTQPMSHPYLPRLLRRRTVSIKRVATPLVVAPDGKETRALSRDFGASRTSQKVQRRRIRKAGLSQKG